MNYNTLIDIRKNRILIAVIAGIMFRLPYDIIIGLQFANYRFVTIRGFFYYFFSVVSAIIVFQIFSVINKRLNKIEDWQNNTRRRFLIQFTLQSLIAVFVCHLFRYSTQFLVYPGVLYVVRIELLSALVILFTILMYVLAEYWNYLILHSRYTFAELERFKKENAEFKLETLMNQVNPHFLFNSLNTLSSLVFENQEAAAKYIRELSKVYRYVLDNKNSELVNLSEEMKLVNAYKFLLELRFQDMIRIEIIVPAEMGEHKIAPLTVQLLIENAVKHNVISRRKNLIITVKAENECLIVSNNVQLKPLKEYSTGMGLSNIKSRYSFFTERKVQIISDEQQFNVNIPLLK